VGWGTALALVVVGIGLCIWPRSGSTLAILLGVAALATAVSLTSDCYRLQRPAEAWPLLVMLAPALLQLPLGLWLRHSMTAAVSPPTAEAKTASPR
jgi:hypothetical protein